MVVASVACEAGEDAIFMIQVGDVGMFAVVAARLPGESRNLLWYNAPCNCPMRISVTAFISAAAACRMHGNFATFISAAELFLVPPDASRPKDEMRGARGPVLIPP